jgi:hypothetical protein
LFGNDFAVHHFVELRSGSNPEDAPFAASLLEDNPVMQAVGASLPKFKTLRDQSKAAPVGG